MRGSVINALASLGYDVVTASTGSEAIRILGGVQRIDLVFADVVLPQGVSGVEVAKEAVRLRRGIRVLLTSGYTKEILRSQGADGNFPVFAKPYRVDELAVELSRILSH